MAAGLEAQPQEEVTGGAVVFEDTQVQPLDGRCFSAPGADLFEQTAAQTSVPVTAQDAQGQADAMRRRRRARGRPGSAVESSVLIGEAPFEQDELDGSYRGRVSQRIRGQDYQVRQVIRCDATQLAFLAQHPRRGLGGRAQGLRR